MARRRLNAKFVAILGASVIALGLAVVYIRRIILHSHPENYQPQAQQAEAGHRWKEAVDYMQQAVNAAPRDPALHVELGHDLNEYGKENQEAVRRRQDVDQWNQALEIDPNFVPALRELLNYWRVGWEAAPNAQTYRNARDQAVKLLAAAPNDPDAPNVEAFIQTMTIRGSIKGLEPDQSLVDKSEARIKELQVKDPANADLPFCLAELAIHRGQVIAESSSSDQPASATAQFRSAVEIMTKALAGQDKNPGMHFNASRVYLSLMDLDRSSSSSTQPASTQPALTTRERYAAAVSREMDRSVELVKPSDANYAQICISASYFAAGLNDMDKSKKIMAGYVNEALTDPSSFGSDVTLALLRAMPELRPQVVKALRKALDAEPKTAEVTLHRFRILYPLVDLEISDLGDTVGETARKSLSDLITLHLQQLDSSRIAQLNVVKERGRFYMAGGSFLSAVQVLDATASTDPQAANDANVLQMLAQSYMQLNEHAQARDYYNRLVAVAPENADARIQLVQLLNEDGTDEARRQISQHLVYLMRSLPDDPRVLRLEIGQLDVQLDAERIKTLYAKLPEKTADDLAQKGVLAFSKLADHDTRQNEALRLYSNAVKLDPGNPGLSINLARLQFMAKRRADAQNTIQDALKIHPDEEHLRIALKELSDATSDQLQKFQADLDASTPDPLDREINLATHAMEAGNVEDAQKHIAAGLKLSPNSGRVLDLQFHLCLALAVQSQAKLNEAKTLPAADLAKADIKSMTAEAKQNWDKLDPIVSQLSALNYDQLNGMSYKFNVAQARQDTQAMIDLGVQLTTQLPQFASSYYYLGQAYQAAGNYDQAINSYNTALQKKGVGQEAALWLKSKIICYHSAKMLNEEIQAINLGRRQYPNDDDFRRYKIQHDNSLKDWDSVVADLKELIYTHQADPDSGAYLDLANTQLRVAVENIQNGNNPQAAQALADAGATMDEALGLFGDDVRMYQEKSEILQQAGKTIEAEQALLDAAKRPALQKNPDPQRLLGQFYLNTGKPDKAEAAYKTAMTLAEGDEKIAVQVEFAKLLSEEGSGLAQVGKAQDADAKFSNALSVLESDNTSNKSILEEMVNVEVQRGDIQGAEKTIKKIKPANSSEEAELETGYAQMELNASRTALADQQNELNAAQLALEQNQKEQSAHYTDLANKAKEQSDTHSGYSLQHVTNALAANPRSPEALFVRAQLYMSRDKPDIAAAMNDVNAALVILPNAVGLLDMRAQLEVLTGHFADSTVDLDKALQNDAGDFTLRIRLAQDYAQYQPVQLDKALQVLVDGESQPGGMNNPNLFNNIATVYQLMGNNDKALQTIKDAMDRIKGNPILIRSYLRLCLSAQQYQDVVDMASNVIDQANKMPDKDAARAAFYWAWQYRGEAYARLGQRNNNQNLKDLAPQDMIQAFSLASGTNDKIEVVISMSHDVDAAKAIDLVRPMADKDPNSWSTMLAILYHQVGRDDDAIDLIGKMVAGITKDMPVNQQVMHLELAGSIYATAQPKPKAQLAYDTYNRLLGLTPNDIQALNNFACVCADDFQPPRVADGLKAISKAMQLLSDRRASDAKVGDTDGWLLILSGNTSDGVDAIKRALAGAQQDFPDAHYHLAEGYLRLGNPTMAQTEVNNALQAVRKAQDNNETVSAQLKASIADLTQRVIDSQRLRTSGSAP